MIFNPDRFSVLFKYIASSVSTHGLFMAPVKYHNMLRELWNENVKSEYKLVLVTPEEIYPEKDLYYTNLCKRIYKETGIKADFDWYSTHFLRFIIGYEKDYNKKFN